MVSTNIGSTWSNSSASSDAISLAKILFIVKTHHLYEPLNVQQRACLFSAYMEVCTTSWDADCLPMGSWLTLKPKRMWQRGKRKKYIKATVGRCTGLFQKIRQQQDKADLHICLSQIHRLLQTIPQRKIKKRVCRAHWRLYFTPQRKGCYGIDTSHLSCEYLCLSWCVYEVIRQA